MKYFVATVVSLLIVAGYIAIAVAAGWRHGGGYIVQVALWSSVAGAWIFTTRHWNSILESFRNRAISRPKLAIPLGNAIATVGAGIIIIALAATLPRLILHFTTTTGGRDSRSLGGEGAKAYAPTRLEWFTLKWNMGNSIDFDLTGKSPYSLFVTPSTQHQNTVTMRVQYLPTMSSQELQMMNVLVDIKRKQLLDSARARGWNWLAVENVVEPLPDLVGQMSRTVTGLQGAMDYVPTRLEWLSVILNSEHSTTFSSESNYSLSFGADAAKNSIVIYTALIPTATYADRILLNQAIANTKVLIERQAQIFGWSEWLKIRVENLQ